METGVFTYCTARRRRRRRRRRGTKKKERKYKLFHWIR
jgi:hypothetical protein